MAEKPRQIPTQEQISKQQIEKRLRELNAKIVLAYETNLKERDRRIILNRLFHEKNKLLALQNGYNGEQGNKEELKKTWVNA